MIPDLNDPANPLHEMHMRSALDEAVIAERDGEVPVGAVILSLDRGEIVAAAHNQREQLRDPTAHAEMIAITQAAAALDDWRLEKCIMYVTLEPCPMCAGAIVQSRLPMVVYGCKDPKAGACDSLYSITNDPRLNHRCVVLDGVLAGDCSEILSNFFRRMRRDRRGRAD